MANKRIKDLTQTATTLASDDYVAIDGSSNGTRKIVKSDLVNDISSQVAGTYLDEANNLSDVASLDTSKLNLEVPDVGTAPNEVPLNGMLGDMAYQSSDGVSMVTATVDNDLTVGNAITGGQVQVIGGAASAPSFAFSNDPDTGMSRPTSNAVNFVTGGTERVRIDSSGRVGIGTASPGQLLHIKSSDPVIRLEDSAPDGIYAQIDGAGGGLILTADSTSGAASSVIKFRIDGSTSASDKWAIYNSGNLVSLTPGNIEISNGNLIIGTSGKGIDFGSAATSAGQGTGTTGSPANSVLSDYEFGSWVPRFEMTGANFAAITMDVIAAQYVKIGRHVHCQASIRTDNLDITGASGSVAVQGLPFVSDTSSGNYGGLSVSYSINWVNAPNSAYVQPNSSYAMLMRNNTNRTSSITPSDMTNGAVANANQVFFTVSYIAST